MHSKIKEALFNSGVESFEKGVRIHQLEKEKQKLKEELDRIRVDCGISTDKKILILDFIKDRDIDIRKGALLVHSVEKDNYEKLKRIYRNFDIIVLNGENKVLVFVEKINDIVLIGSNMLISGGV